MLDCDVMRLINVPEIDRAQNAMTLTHSYHGGFGKFELFFEPVSEKRDTYEIKSLDPIVQARSELPIVRTFLLTENRPIEPPSPQLLLLHRAIAHVLYLSGAGEYIDQIIRDLEETGVRADGSTDLGRLVNVALNGWLDGAVNVY